MLSARAIDGTTPLPPASLRPVRRAHQRSAARRQAVEDLQRYLSTNRERMRYRTFRAAGYQIGGGAAESAIGHVIQQRMKRAGVRWGVPGADQMPVLQSRVPGHWSLGHLLAGPGSLIGKRMRRTTFVLVGRFGSLLGYPALPPRAVRCGALTGATTHVGEWKRDGFDGTSS